MKWSKSIDRLFDAGQAVSFARLVEAEAGLLDREFEKKRNAELGMDRLKIEPKARHDSRTYVPIQNADSPCQRTINRLRTIQAKWKMTKLQLEGESTEQEKLTDAEICERFNNRTQAVATVYQNKPVRLYYELIR